MRTEFESMLFWRKKYIFSYKQGNSIFVLFFFSKIFMSQSHGIGYLWSAQNWPLTKQLTFSINQFTPPPPFTTTTFHIFANGPDPTMGSQERQEKQVSLIRLPPLLPLPEQIGINYINQKLFYVGPTKHVVFALFWEKIVSLVI